MLGAVTFVGTDGYQELLQLQSGETRLIECDSPTVNPMYRVEYTDERGYGQHAVFYTWPEAEANFERRAELYG